MTILAPKAPRNYQQAAHDAQIQYLTTKNSNGLIVLPTGTGKAFLIAMLCKTLREKYGARIFVLTHVKELVDQNYKEFVEYWSDAKSIAGIYSAGLKKRDTRHPIIFGGIMSIHRHLHKFGTRNVAIIDEAHLIPHKQTGVYRKVLQQLQKANKDFRVIGLTATAYRMSSGMLTDPWKEDLPLFDDIVFEKPLNWFIENGYLCEPIPYKIGTRLDVSGVRKIGGEYASGALEDAVDIDETTKAAIRETQQAAFDRCGVLFFGAGNKHVANIAKFWSLVDGYCGVVTSNSCGIFLNGKFHEESREKIIEQFKKKELRALVNNNILTTGFNAPHVDVIACLRPTKSPGLWVQMIGRGTRLADGKNNCLILDFAGNGKEHGPLDEITGKKKPRLGGVAPYKECPECFEPHNASARKCKRCNYQWPEAELRIYANSQAEALLSTQSEPQWFYVTNVSVEEYETSTGFISAKITYECGISHAVPEYVNLENPRAKYFTLQWWRQHTGEDDAPDNILDFMKHTKDFRFPGRILIAPDGKYQKIVSKDFTI